MAPAVSSGRSRVPYLSIGPGLTVITLILRLPRSVEVVPTFDMGGAQQSGNLAILAYMGPEKTADLGSIGENPIHPMASNLVNANLQKRFRFPESQGAILLTDDYNPIDFFDADLRESVRRDILATTNRDILLYSD